MIKAFVTIEGKDVSPYCTEFSCDGSINTRSEPTKSKIILANINRMWDEAFTPQKDHFVIKAQGIDSSGKEFIWPIAAGIISDVLAEPDYCTVNGTCLIGHLADALPVHWSSNRQGVTVKEVLEEVLAKHDPPITVDYQASNPILVQKEFDACTTFQEVINYCVAQVDGAITFVDETGHLHVWSADHRRPFIDLDYHVTEQNAAKSLMGYINMVTVHGDDSQIPTGEPGSENSQMTQIYGNAVDQESVAKYGELIGPDIYLPNIKTKEEAESRANELLKFLRINRDGLTNPTVVGMAPYLCSLVKYTCKNGPNGQEIEVKGIVTRKVVSFSADGFTTKLEISPYMNAVEKTEDLAERLEELEEYSESNMPELGEAYGD